MADSNSDWVKGAGFGEKPEDPDVARRMRRTTVEQSKKPLLAAGTVPDDEILAEENTTLSRPQ